MQIAALSRLCDPTFRLSVTEATQSGADGDIDRGVVYSLKSQVVQHFPRAPVWIIVILRDEIQRGNLCVASLAMGLLTRRVNSVIWPHA